MQKDLLRLHQQWPQLKLYSEELLQHYPDHSAGIHRIHLTVASKHITLDLLYGDACTSLESIYHDNGFRVDAWYLDGFSPRLNPDMWSADLFRVIALLSKKGTTLSTYSVAGNIRRGLAAVGFAVTKETGFAQKRHMLCADYIEQKNTTNDYKTNHHSSPWFTLPARQFSTEKRVCIIGAGLAGCASAYALAKRGWSVTLIERSSKIASMASGNPKGILHCNISKKETPYSSYLLQAYLYAIRHYLSIEKESSIDWQQCGSIQLAYNDSEQQKQSLIIQQARYSTNLFQAIDAKETNLIAGLEVNMDGLFFPDSACLSPQLLCQYYCSHPGITVLLNSEVIDLNKSEQHWQITTRDSNHKPNILIGNDAVIIANSYDADKFQLTKHYPLIPNRGQVNFYRTTPQSRDLKTNLCSNAYITPAFQDTHSIGGTYTANCKNSKTSNKDTNNNLNLLKKTLTNIATDFIDQTETGARAAIRCSTPDYAPVIGPVENYSANQTIYSELSRNAHKKINKSPEYESGLFVNLAHGSYGLTSTPLAAEYLASMLNNEPLPIPSEQIQCLHPIRFLIRSLKKQQS